MENKSDFLKLLVKNDKKKIHEYILANGKTKPIAPIRFMTEEEKEAIKNGTEK